VQHHFANCTIDPFYILSATRIRCIVIAKEVGFCAVLPPPPKVLGSRFVRTLRSIASCIFAVYVFIHDIFDYQWNLNDLRWSIYFHDLYIDGIDGFKDNSKNILDVDISASDLCVAQLWVRTKTQSIRNHRM
jgi:hypothetical protein